jgi:hypothetical protein
MDFSVAMSEAKPGEPVMPSPDGPATFVYTGPDGRVTFDPHGDPIGIYAGVDDAGNVSVMVDGSVTVLPSDGSIVRDVKVPDTADPPPEWFMENMPDFITAREANEEYRRYLATVREKQWHGLTHNGVHILLREEPGQATRVDDAIEPSGMKSSRWWGAEAPTYRLADYILKVTTPDGLWTSAMVNAFSKLIIKNMPDEWFLTDVFINQWLEAMRD